MTSPWMDVAEAAAYIGASEKALYKLVALQDVAYSRRGPGRRAPLMFHVNDLDELLTRRRVEAQRFRVRRSA